MSLQIENLDTLPTWLPPHETWMMVDSTKLTSYSRCPREFFFEYVMGWRTDLKGVALAAGSAWHKAMEVLLAKGNLPENHEEAYAVYMDEFIRHFGAVGNADLKGRDPANIRKALGEYIATYPEGTDPWTPLHVELPGQVPLDDRGRALTMRLDLVAQLRNGEGVVVVDHKTTSMDSFSWRQSFTLSLQLGGYIHALYCIYPPDEVWGAVINGAILRPAAASGRGLGNGFARIEIRRTEDQQEAWLAEVLHLVYSIERDFQRLTVESQEEPDEAGAMVAFQRRTNQCVRYNSMCPYHNICVMRSNPLTLCQQTPPDDAPPGFIKEFWNPVKHESETVGAKPAKLQLEGFDWA